MKIGFSMFLATLVVGGILYAPFLRVLESERYLEAAVARTYTTDVHFSDRKVSSRDYSGRDQIPFERVEDEVAVMEESEESLEQTESTPKTVAETNQQPVVQKEVVPVVTAAQEEKAEQEESPLNSDDLYGAIFDALNAERKKRGLSKVTIDPALDRIAQAHTGDMAQKRYLAHKDKHGCDLTCRLKEAGYKALAWAENLIYIENEYLLDTEETAERMMKSWLASGGHRENIHNGDYTHVGIGVARNGDRVYVTTDFALPK